jgi:hypothetical protein
MLAREPEDGHRADRDRRCLADEQQRRARPDEPERGENGKQRIDVGAESRHLVALQVRNLERLAMRRRPDRLHHVSEIEATALERSMTQDRESAEASGEGHDSAGDYRSC